MDCGDTGTFQVCWWDVGSSCRLDQHTMYSHVSPPGVCVYSKRLHVFECVWSYVLALFCISVMERRCQQVSRRTRERLTCRTALPLTSLLTRRRTNTALLASTAYWKWIWIRRCVQPCQGLGKDFCVNVKESRSRTMADLDGKLDLCINNSANFNTSDVQTQNWCWC